MTAFLRSVRYLFCAIILLGIGIWGCSAVFQDRQILQPIDVAVVVPEEKAQELEFLTDLVSAMQSTKSVSRFHYRKEAEALRELKNGEIQAVLVFSRNLYQDLDEGRNTSVKLYVTQETVPGVQMFQELLKDGISMICTAEAGVYAVLDQAGTDELNPAYEDPGMQVAMYYLQAVFNRSHIFDNAVASPYGIYERRQYNFSTGLLWILLFMGLSFTPLYRKEHRALESRLRMYGIGPVRIAFVNVMAMANLLFLIAGGSYTIGCIVNYVKNGTFLFFDIWTVAGLYLVCLTFAVWYQVLFSIVGHSANGMLVLISCEGILALGSGWIVPITYLPRVIRQISGWLPLYQWNRCNMNLLFGSASWREFGCLGIWLLIGILAEEVTICVKRLSGISFC